MTKLDDINFSLNRNEHTAVVTVRHVHVQNMSTTRGISIRWPDEVDLIKIRKKIFTPRSTVMQTWSYKQNDREQILSTSQVIICSYRWKFFHLSSNVSPQNAEFSVKINIYHLGTDLHNSDTSVSTESEIM